MKYLNKTQEKVIKKLLTNYKVNRTGYLTQITLNHKVIIWIDTKGLIHDIELKP